MLHDRSGRTADDLERAAHAIVRRLSLATPCGSQERVPSQVVILVEDRLEKLEEIRNRTTAELTGTQEELGRCRRSTAGSVPHGAALVAARSEAARG